MMDSDSTTKHVQENNYFNYISFYIEKEKSRIKEMFFKPEIEILGLKGFSD